MFRSFPKYDMFSSKIFPILANNFTIFRTHIEPEEVVPSPLKHMDISLEQTLDNKMMHYQRDT